MKRRLLWIALAAALAFPCAWAQEPERTENAAEHGKSEEPSAVWSWLNFALLAGGLIWIFRKNAVPYFAARAIGIRKGMVEAEDARLDAERRIDAVEAQLGRLHDDIQALKNESIAEDQTARDRFQTELAEELAKIRTHAEQEIGAAGKTARMDLKRYSAALAMELAEQKIRARLTPATQDGLFRGFVHELRAVAGPQST